MSPSESSDSLTLDQLDRQIVRCLQLHPRAAFSLVAQTLQCSEQTVARRYRRLLRSGVLRVVTAVDPRALGESDWMVRVQCRPEGTLDLGRALSRREDVGWVAAIAGGSELICAVRSRTAVDRERLLVDRLPRTTAVLNLSAAVVLRRFVGGSSSDWLGVDDALTPAQEQHLGTPTAAGEATRQTLQPADNAMLAVLADDGRASYSRLAAAAGTTDARAARRLATLLDSGVVYLDVDLAAAALGYPVSAYVWLTVPPAHLESACEALAAHSETPFVAAISGRDNVIASVTCRSLDHLYEYVTMRIGAIEGVQAIEVSPVLRRFKQAGSLMDGDRLAPLASTARPRGR